MTKENELAPRDAALFRSTLKFYEFKQYKKGLKVCDQILKKYPNHGETTSMKGLFSYHLGRKDAAFDLAKQGIKLNLKSHICWHVYGLIYREDKNYEEAMKCYKNALKIDKENFQIIRDLATMQLQMRYLEGYNETRKLMLNLRPSAKNSWIGLAQSFYFLKEYEAALQFLDSYLQNCKEDPLQNPIEISEFYQFKFLILEKLENHQEALNLLDENESKFLNKLYLTEKRGKYNDLLAIIDKLLERNTENRLYMQLLEVLTRGLFQNDNQQKIEFYRDKMAKYPKSIMLKLELISLLDETELKQHLSEFLSAMFEKGVPSLFQLLKPFYSRIQVAIAAENVIKDITATVSSNSTTKLWVLNYYARHLDYGKNYKQALKVIEEALSQEKENIDLLLTKGRILKHMGQTEQASECVEIARSLDLADRYLNAKSTKYFIRANKLEEAEKIVVLFSKEAANGLQDLVDMQCLWYALEVGEAHIRLGNLKEAFKYFGQVEAAFNTFYDDHFDFHAYCARKLTLCSYAELIEFEDLLRTNKYYLRMAKNTIPWLLKSSLIMPLEQKMADMSIKEDRQSNLMQAMKIASKLPDSSLDANILKFHVYYENSQLCLAFKCLKASIEQSEKKENVVCNPEVFRNLIVFWNSIDKLPEEFLSVASELFSKLCEGIDQVEYTQKFLNLHQKSLLHIFEYLSATKCPELGLILSAESFSLKEALQVWNGIQNGKEEEIKKIQEFFKISYPECKIFQ